MKHLIATMLAFAAGCQTHFTGSSHIAPATCHNKCATQGLQMTGMIYMGEYSSACVCEVPRPQGSPATAASGAAVAAAATGVVMQMRKRNANTTLPAR